MSGGQQRVALAVALANDPAVLLADEPTGELDSHTGEQVFAAFRTANERLGTTIVIVTHDQAVAGEVRPTVAIRDGRTSPEVLRRSEVDAATGDERLVSREYALLDRAGRRQLPAEYTASLGVRDRVALELEPDHIAVCGRQHGGLRSGTGRRAGAYRWTLTTGRLPRRLSGR
jgi:energy-coupling factor transporter ATP-binding protein EcfA2